MIKKIKVRVFPGFFLNENIVSFKVENKEYGLIVDTKDVVEDCLNVFVLWEKNDEAMIRLPRPTFNSGSNNIIVPTSLFC